MKYLITAIVILSLLSIRSVTSLGVLRSVVKQKPFVRLQCTANPSYNNNNQNNDKDVPNVDLTKLQNIPAPRDSKKLAKRWATGLSLGALGTIWIFSGNGIFTLGFLFASLVALNEYYAMVKAAGARCEDVLVAPAAKTGTVASLACYITAAFFPEYHELVLPLAASWLMIWLLIFNKRSPSISEISTSLLGMFYIGYLPSFWVRLRALQTVTQAPTLFPALLGRFEWMQVSSWTAGSMITWWTWTSIVFADVGAYFIGKAYGKRKLSSISSAAGSASPNKTVEGALGGFACGTIFATIGAYLMQWPKWPVLGVIYGLIITFIGLVGDLTASMMKRDAGIKDTGSILPGHGGLLDRFDSYMLTAPIAYFFCIKVLPIVDLLQASKLNLVDILKLVINSIQLTFFK